MLFITHALPKALKIDEVLHIGKEGVQQLKTVPTSGISPLEATH